MKERFLKVLKWFFIILGVLFLLQFLIIIGAVLGLVSFANFDFKAYESKSNIKPFENIIIYLDKYNEENGKYPNDIASLKTDKKYDFEYKTTSDNNCYTIVAKSKNSSLIKQYNKCSIKSSDSSSTSQSYVEYNAKE